MEEISDIMKFASSEDVVRDEEQSPFNYLIGANTSLKNQIEQAKAALLYPPNGLHTLIIGSTGVGKAYLSI
ncbi:transcriptional regulator with AAA-type ATPase domain [Clostridium beijerinckii]|nr:transcriptional regulator with AAA-type ATPase domain [Clostridium beijerinckii]